MNRFTSQTLAITGGFLAAYFLIRSLPVEPCEVLHTQKLDNGGVAEFCGPDEADYYPVTQMRFPVRAHFTAKTKLQPGQTATMSLSLSGPGGDPLEVDEIATSHGEKLHLMLIDPSLEDYWHLHPEPTPEPGIYRFSFQPERAGTYQAFLEFVSAETTRRIMLADVLTVGDTAGESHAPIFGALQPAKLGPLTASLADLPERGLRAGDRTTFSLAIEHQQGAPLTFEPIMNSYAHLVIFDEDRVGLAHAHPIDFNLATTPAVNPPLRFSVRLPEPGNYRLWAQFQIDGQLCQVPFDLTVN